MVRKGLGKGLDSLIPDFYNEDFDSNSTLSLEDLLNETEDKVPEEETIIEESEDINEENTPNEELSSDIEEETPVVEVSNDNDDTQKNIFEQIEEEKNDQKNSIDSDEDVIKKEIQVDTEESEVVSGIQGGKEGLPTPQELKVKEHVAEVKEIVDKNPRITLWSSRSSAVFRYLRKTEPEFSISKEASKLIEEAVAKKYPEIWALFDEY
ncbi:AAA family ATPase [uncultured Methanobrevibacter sp.]|uniref:AAA family ATPase n=1 Tax=uncultured Methanobrevibacter sp. TaxID=253161 RepID=UPI0025FF65AF|nr:AAA family ATPase [uncultured Methanobrevibacter sp.]MCI6993399.1 AAA family ATPase [Methanobrevibacter sp.]